MSFALVPVAEAALFTLGCLLIHTLRRHADVVTATLACVATLLVLMIGIACAPESFVKYQGASITEFARLDPAIY
ncbi:MULTISPECIES: hypothetical protein [Methylobacterium]|jgi:hypothetical protein|uniref:hypothetical protein n=1 Tax=Methylobacterium TaxID=407 RepID=UPI0011CA434A|nr:MULTISPECIES: hypothetical protein [Methylobacterium]TXN48565.1 hypothetical protein FV233_00915 [Methylobacterium sp. WL7]TXN71104.1 hypothetical protein FV228_11795 [Methylobacterium sp. WL18]GJE21397.1 hypothetical protein JHFBIEKO_1839 [Methylobacterium mesophilicum]